MPLLGPLKCSVCGSAELQLVKPDAYFCNHCESVSKLVDPARVTVEPAFCAHGDPITARCQVCGAGLCAGACEMARGTCEDMIMTVGFGYLYVDLLRGGDRPVATGPFLTRGKLLDSLAITSGQRLRHLCEPCLRDAVPAAAEHLASHALCEDPWCMYSDYPLGECACCGGTFCDQSVRGDKTEFDADVSFAYSLADSALIETKIGVKATVPVGSERRCRCTSRRA